jgi:NADPH:quinone reductase-like Zn-dependent oxidoreductase
VPLSDGAGEVMDIGEGVSRWKVGDRVCPIFMQGWLEGAVTPERGGPRSEAGIWTASCVNMPPSMRMAWSGFRIISP